MRALVTIFVGLLIIYSLYLLSFTWFVNSHKKEVETKAMQFVKTNYLSASQKYPTDKDSQAIYQETLDQLTKARYERILDSTKDKSVTWWGTSYQKAKENELLLGLDLQGGINVTLNIELSGLIKGLANNPGDPSLKKALDEANRRKLSSDADYITLFTQSFKDVNPGTALAPLFANSTRNKLKIDASDNQVVTYLRDQALAGMKQTYTVIRNRIDQFGVAQPNINLDENKGIITVELAGASDPERVRKFLQSTANLQFFEVYNISELDKSLEAADKALAIAFGGVKPVDSTKLKDSLKAIADKGTDTSKSGKSLSAILKDKQVQQQGNSKTPAPVANDHPLTTIVQFIPPRDDNKDGKYEYSSTLGVVRVQDTGMVNTYMENPAFKNNMPGDVKFLYGMPEKTKEGKSRDILPLYAIKTLPGTEGKAKLGGSSIIDAYQDFNPVTNQVTVNMTMDKQGEKTWAKMTGDNIGRSIAIVLDNIVYSAPNVNDKIEGGNSQISGGFSVQEGLDLSSILKSGKLDAPAKIVQEQTVGPTLGQASVKGGAMAFFISFIVIFALMLVYYNTGGWVANIALILNLLFTVGVLTAFNATLTAAGIAGLVLTIGMAVDTNVIIFERIKEELTRGKSYPQAVKDGYQRSLSPVLDAHVTTLLTAFILFYFGLGPVLGFATTQIIGILLSLLCGIVVSRLITDFWTNKNRHFNYFTPISRRIFKHSNFKFIEYRKVAYGISVVVLLLGIGAVIHGFRYGVEFQGGRNYVVAFDTPVKEDNVRDALGKVYGSSPTIKTFGDSRHLDITTDYLISQPGIEVDAKVQDKLFEGLKPFLRPGISQAEFVKKHVQQSKKVDPTISDDLKTGAKWATFWSLLVISIYIFIRFRDWRYSMGTIFALLHDVLVTVAVFSFLKDIVPFPLEIDQHFIAAILTVIGFSMNDTVIVFDRVREYSHTMKGATKGEIINKAVNDTLSRTIMTSVTVFLTLLILFLVGGEVTKGFAFAMLIGVITGTYSSIFVAAPILVDFGKKKSLGESSDIALKSKIDTLKMPEPATK